MTTVTAEAGPADRLVDPADAMSPIPLPSGAGLALSLPEPVIPVGAASMRLLEVGLAFGSLLTALLLGLAR